MKLRKLVVTLQVEVAYEPYEEYKHNLIADKRIEKALKDAIINDVEYVEFREPTGLLTSMSGDDAMWASTRRIKVKESHTLLHPGEAR